MSYWHIYSYEVVVSNETEKNGKPVCFVTVSVLAFLAQSSAAWQRLLWLILWLSFPFWSTWLIHVSHLVNSWRFCRLRVFFFNMPKLLFGPFQSKVTPSYCWAPLWLIQSGSRRTLNHEAHKYLRDDCVCVLTARSALWGLLENRLLKIPVMLQH